MEYLKINYDFIDKWCMDNNQDAWLEARLDKPFITIKMEFVNTFMPEIKPTKKAKPLTMREKFEARRKKAK